MKQGPAPIGQTDGNCDDDCREEESRHWKAIVRFKDIDVDINDSEKFELCPEDKPIMIENLIMRRFNDNGYNSMHGGNKYYIKNCPNPVTDIILSEGKISSVEDIVVIARDIFGHEIKENVDFLKRIFVRLERAR